RLIEACRDLDSLDQFQRFLTSKNNPIRQSSCDFHDQSRLEIRSDRAGTNSQYSQKQDGLALADLISMSAWGEDDYRQMLAHLGHVAIEALSGSIDVDQTALDGINRGGLF